MRLDLRSTMNSGIAIPASCEGTAIIQQGVNGVPLPILLVPIGAAALSASGVIAARMLRKLPGKSVAILGGHQVGKSVLLRYLRTASVTDDGRSTIDPEQQAVFELQLGRKKLKFTVPREMPSNEGLGHPLWREAFRKADHVWYLFRADLIADGDPDEVRRLRNDLDLLKQWRQPRASKPPRIILIGTWADRVPSWKTHPIDLLEKVRSADPLKLGAVKLGNAPVLLGSLVNDEDAKELVNRLKENLT